MIGGRAEHPVHVDGRTVLSRLAGYEDPTISRPARCGCGQTSMEDVGLNSERPKTEEVTAESILSTSTVVPAIEENRPVMFAAGSYRECRSKEGEPMNRGLLVLLSWLVLAGTRVVADESTIRKGRTQMMDKSNSLRHLVPARWWEKASGMIGVTLSKPGRRKMPIDPEEASFELDRLKAMGFDAMEIVGPAESLFAYGGLDVKDHYRIDPEVGTMDDFRRLVRIAHSKSIAVSVFYNLGYMSLESPHWIEACKDKKAGKDTEKVRWFLWADDADAPPPGPEDSVFAIDKTYPGDGPDKADTWGWNYSELAGCYYWARWEARQEDGSLIGLPQNNWFSGEWPEEVGRIVRFWMDTGLDGMSIDAPNFYSGLTWEKNNRYITDVVKSYGNTFLWSEGGRYLAFLTDGGYNCLYAYGFRLWGNKWNKDSFTHALESGDPSHIEESLRNYHDRVVGVGGVLYQVIYRPDDDAKRHLERAALAGIGHLIGGGSDLDAEETWIMNTKRLHPALHQNGRRRNLPTNADDKYYAFVKTAADNSERILVVLNFQSTTEKIKVDLSFIASSGLVELKKGELTPHKNPLEVTLPPYEYRFYQVLSVE